MNVLCTPFSHWVFRESGCFTSFFNPTRALRQVKNVAAQVGMSGVNPPGIRGVTARSQVGETKSSEALASHQLILSSLEGLKVLRD